DLLGEGFDLAIRIARLADSSLIARRLAPVRNVICSSPGYWSRHSRPQHPRDLANHDCLHYSLADDPGTWRYADAAERPGSVKTRGVLRANNGDVLRDLAIAGHGVALLPTFIVFEAIAAGRLEVALTDFEWAPLAAYAVYPHSRHLSTRIRAFVDYLAKRFGDRPYWDDCIGHR
ncbi:MAG: substrate binding domain-containing protein, partial [Chromatiales bacterium]|nr:substrate binding domain-containing protein [Chromatiales bacterium]